MPLGGNRLTEDQIATIRVWIESSAPRATQEGVTTPVAQLTQHDIIPIMYLRCSPCHGLRRQEGGLDLRTKASMLKGGKSGPAIVRGQPDKSLVIQRIRAGEMPPKKDLLQVSVKLFTPAETERLTAWIAQGAPEENVVPDVAGVEPDPLVSDKDRRFWAFQPPKPVMVPSVRHDERVRNGVDAFILSKLEAKGLSLSPEADRLTLIRRACFDLTGLPPERHEVEAFLADRNPEAYEKLIDRLLASPRYGERWGRYWLDVAGYADSEGGKLSADHQREDAYRYRDYVIRSFNADKSYDRFLLEQIAGDELVDYERASAITEEMMDDLIATGFLRMGPDSTDEREVNFVDDRLDVIGDEIDILSAGVFGLTMKCARCHSHKYDPIPQRDYYRLLDIFKGAYDEHDWMVPQSRGSAGKTMVKRHLPYVTPGLTPAQLMQQEQEREGRNQELDRQIEALKAALEQKAEPIKKKLLENKLNQLPQVLREDLRKMLETPMGKRTEVEKYLAEKFEQRLKIEPEELKKSDAAFRSEAEETEKKVKLLEYRKLSEPRIRALWDRGVPSPTYLLRRGEPTNFGRLVGPGVPSVLTDGKTPFEVKPPWPGAQKTGRRLALAQWLICPDHPLTARVMVNRIWKHHFGVGIVKTLGNFGTTGTPPSHPELLDWLAAEFVRQGWSMKAMHRLMMTSSAYRQSSAVTPLLEKADLDNVLLSRMPLKRMEAEVLYDTLVLISGRLDETRYGVPAPVLVRGDGLVTPIETENGWRRGIYVEQRRTQTPTILESFDFPSMSPNCLERPVSTVAPQALYLVNSAMVRDLARSFAQRVEKEVGADPEKQVERAFWIALSRPPKDEEKQASLEALLRLRDEHAKQLREQKGMTPKPADMKQEVREAKDWQRSQQREAALLALAKFVHTLVNSASFLYID
jgi:Protein of unknown function (DUF1553)/Protein of unknown function (DUF1549)/Planctomycete cytochrome C